MAAENEISQLFSDLELCEKNGNYAKGSKIANKILEKVPNDKDAFQCKIVCFMQQGKFHDALQILKSSRVKKGLSLPFEEAYCLYRLNKTKEALDVLTAVEEPLPKEKELLAQVYYRLEEYKKCYELYTGLIKNSQDDFGDERETNLAAVIAASWSSGQSDLSGEGLREDTYELCYNAACLSIADNEIETAHEKLLIAEDLCKKSMEEDGDITEQEIESELGVLRVQRGYTCQILGKDDEAMKLYNQVLKSRPNDVAISAVASNNIVTLNKDRDIFDSKKKIKVATADGIETKLNFRQRQYIAFNRCLVLMYSNQNEVCRKAAKGLESKYPENDFPILIQAALLFREKQYQEAVNILEEHVKARVKCSMQVSLAIVQLHLFLGNSVEACKRLRTMNAIKNRPAVVALLVNLYTHAGDVDAAVQVLDDAVAYAKDNESTVNREELVRLLRENVAYKLKREKTKEALKILEYLHDLDPNDLKTIAHLVAAYSQIDPKKSEQYSMKLPPLEGDELDVNALEVSLGTRYARKTAKLASEGVKPKQDEKQDVVVKRRRKKKPGKLPKNYNPEVDPDPERWLPRRERSYFKGKRQKKASAVGKGTQGATASQESPSARSVSSPKATSPPGTPGGASSSSSTGVVPPRQQQPQASKKKQRPKKKKGGW